MEVCGSLEGEGESHLLSYLFRQFQAHHPIGIINLLLVLIGQYGVGIVHLFEIFQELKHNFKIDNRTINHFAALSTYTNTRFLYFIEATVK